MATISTLAQGNSTASYHLSRQGNVSLPYRAEVYIDFADAITAKGSALAQGDIIECIKVPAGSQVLFAGFQKMNAMTGTSTDLTFDLGVTGGDVDAFVDGFDYDAASALAYGTVATAAITPATFFSTADTIDLLFATQTGTLLTGIIRVFAVILDVSAGDRAPGYAQLGS